MTKSIHHATAKRAEDNGIIMSIAEDTGIIGAQAADKHSNVSIGHASAKVALDAAILARTLEAEYPAIGIENATDKDGDPDHAAGLVLRATEDGTEIATYADGVIPGLAEVLDAAIEAGIDPEEGAEDDTGPVVVVAPKYKQRYADGGHPEHCGDWLAYQLEGAFATSSINEKGKAVEAFDVEAFTGCLTDNGIALEGKWAALPTSGQPGWQGRYRMNGRQKLERQVAACGELVLHGETIEVPEEALEVLRAKHPKAYQPETEATESE